jgi:hypothetical protein
MKASSEPHVNRRRIDGARRPKTAKAIPKLSTTILPQKLNMILLPMRAIYWAEAARDGMCSTSHFFIDDE